MIAVIESSQARHVELQHPESEGMCIGSGAISKQDDRAVPPPIIRSYSTPLPRAWPTISLLFCTHRRHPAARRHDQRQQSFPPHSFPC
jgi:hypothetical protein